ncbi:Mitochondrial metalloendopeptidase OMA1 [Chlorella vulgaris]
MLRRRAVAATPAGLRWLLQEARSSASTLAKPKDSSSLQAWRNYWGAVSRTAAEAAPASSMVGRAASQQLQGASRQGCWRVSTWQQQVRQLRNDGYQHFGSGGGGGGGRQRGYAVMYSAAARRRAAVWVAVVGGGGVVVWVSSRQEIPYTKRMHAILVSPQSEAEMGQQTFQQVLAEARRNGTLLPPNHRAVQSVRRVGTRIAQAASDGFGGGFQGHMEGLEWEFAVVDSPQVNAFVVPGGKASGSGALHPGMTAGCTFGLTHPNCAALQAAHNLAARLNACPHPDIGCVGLGLLRMVANEDELAAVLAHEGAHVVARHAAERITQMGAVEVARMMAYWLFGLPIPSGPLSAIFFLPNSRKAETEADLIGLQIMSRACYNPTAMITMFEKMGHAETREGGDRTFKFLRTHPHSSDRIKAIQAMLPTAEGLYEMSGCDTARGTLASHFRQNVLRGTDWYDGSPVKALLIGALVVGLLCCAIVTLAPIGSLMPSNRVRLHLNLGTNKNVSSLKVEGNEQQVKGTVEALGAALQHQVHLAATEADSQQATAAAVLATPSGNTDQNRHKEEAKAAGKQEVAAEQQQSGAGEQQQEEQRDGATANKQEEEQRDGAEEAEQQGGAEEAEQQDGAEEEQLVPTPAAPTAAEDQQEKEEMDQDAAGEQGGLFDGSASHDVSEARGLKFAQRFKDCDNSGQFSCLNRQNNWKLGTSGGQRQFRFPHFYIAGFQKCATTSLFHHLIHHPQVQEPSIKEPEFFTKACSYNAMRCITSQQRGYMRDTLNFRRIQQANFTKAAFEGSTHYGLEGRWLAMQLREHFPWIKIVLTMREPISQAISMVNHMLERHGAARDCYDRKKGLVYECINEDLDYESRYAKSVRPWVKHIPREQLHVLQYENLTSDANMAPALRDLKSFLEVDPLLPSDDLGLKNFRHQRGGEHSEGWPMSRSQYESLVEKARRNAEEIAELVRAQGYADADAWMANWEAAWKMNLKRCQPGPEGKDGPPIKALLIGALVVGVICCAVFTMAPTEKPGFRPSNRVRLHLNLGSGNSASSWEMEGNEQLVKSTVEALGAALDEVAHLPATAADSQQATAAAALATSSDSADPHGEEKEAEAADKQEVAEGQQQPGAQEQHQEDQQASAVEEAQQDAAEEAEQHKEQQDGAKANTQEEDQRDGAEEAEQQDGAEEAEQQDGAEEEQLVPTPAAPTAAEDQEEQQEEKEDAANEQGGLFDGSASQDVSEARGLEFAQRFNDCDNSGQFSCLNRQNNWKLGTSGGQRQFRFPHFYIAGFQKCATTSLFSHLIHHPQVQGPTTKEPEFFTKACSYNAMRCITSQQRGYMRDVRASFALTMLHCCIIELTLNFRRIQQANFTKAAFEGSTHYGLEGRWLAMQLREHFPWIKIVLTMREPISQAISMLNHQLDHKRFPECYDREKGLAFECIHVDLDYESRYAKSVRPWVKHIPRDQLHVLQYENLTSDANMAPALRDLKSFLEIDPLLPSDDLGLKNFRHQRGGEHSEGWPMSRSQYESLVEKARRNAEEIVELVRAQGYADADAWMANWEAAWKMNLKRCQPGPEGKPFRRFLLVATIALAGYAWTHHSRVSAVIASHPQPPLQQLSLQQPGNHSGYAHTAAEEMAERASAGGADEKQESAAGEKHEEDVTGTEGAAGEASSSSAAAAGAGRAVGGKAEPREQQQAQEQHSYVPSPFEDALRACSSLSCIREAHKQPKHPGQFNFPHFYLLGFPKCATTSLFHHLIQHPQVMAPVVKEPEFFTNLCKDSAAACDPHEQELYINTTLHRDIALSARMHMTVFEGSTHYSLAGDWLAPQLKELMPWVKLVLSIREPISRAISMLQHNLDHQRFPKCYDRERRLIFKCIKANLEDSSVRYAPRLKAWVENFPVEQLHIMQYEDLTGSGMKTALRDLKRFIGIDPKLPSASPDDLGLHNARRDNYTEGWPMTLQEYRQLVALAREDTGDALSMVAQHGVAAASRWQQAWERVWQPNSPRAARRRSSPVHEEQFPGRTQQYNRSMLRIHQAIVIVLLLLQLGHAARHLAWSNAHGVSGPLPVQSVAAQLVAAIWMFGWPQAYWRNRFWLIPVFRISIAYLTPADFRSVATAASFLERPAQPGWRGAFTDMLRALHGMRLLSTALVSILTWLPPSLGLLTNIALGLLMRDDSGYCCTTLLSAPLTQIRMQTVATILDHVSLPLLILLPAGNYNAGWTDGASSAALGAEPQLQLCSALLTFQWLVLGVLVPLLLTLRWARPPLAPEAASNPQRGGVWGAVYGRVARGFAACDSVLQWSAAGEGMGEQSSEMGCGITRVSSFGRCRSEVVGGRVARPQVAAAALLLAAAQGLLTAAETVQMECQSLLWAGLPLAKQQPSAEEYDPSAMTYYKDWTLKHVLPPFVLCCITAALLLSFLLWRLAKLATCMRCMRSPELRGKPAHDLLAARSTRWLRAAVPLLAAGVIAGAGFGFSTIEPGIEPAGVSVYEQTQAYVASGLEAANLTLGATQAVQSDLTAMRQRALDLNLERFRPGLVQVIDDFLSSMGGVSNGLQTAASDIQEAVLDRMQELQAEWQPLADRLDIVKNVALYACYVLVIASAAGVGLGAALNWPGMVKGSLVQLLLLILLTWAAVAASTAGLKIGSDGCAVVEPKVVKALMKEAERQKTTGKGVLAAVGVGGTQALARYFFYGVGKSPAEVLYDLTQIDIPELLSSANVTLTGLQEVAALLEGVSPAAQTLPASLDALAVKVRQVAGNVSDLEAALSFEQFNAAYMGAKSYLCCDVLNFVGGLWLALLIIGCCGLPLTLAVFFWLGRMDRLQQRGCCHMYRRGDYRLQAAAGPAASAVPELPQKLEGAGSGGAAARQPLPHAAAAAFSLALQHKLAVAGTWPPRHGIGGTDGGFSSAAGSESFRIGTAPLAPLATPRGGMESAELLADLTPSAPPLSARNHSLPVSARGGSQLMRSAQAAGGSGRILSSAGASSSAPNSARRGSIGGAASSSAAADTLTPAAHALLPPSLHSMQAIHDDVEAAAGPPEQQQQQVTPGGSAMRRAGNALARLKYIQRSK